MGGSCVSRLALPSVLVLALTPALAFAQGVKISAQFSVAPDIFAVGSTSRFVATVANGNPASKAWFVSLTGIPVLDGDLKTNTHQVVAVRGGP